MSGGVYGADVEQLRLLARKFAASGSNLLDLAKTLDYLINSPEMWSGPDAERFRSDWNGRDKSAVIRSADALNDGASTLTRNAAEQEQASAGGGASALHGGSNSHAVPATSPGLPVAAGGSAVTDERAMIEMYHNLRQLQVGGLTASDYALLAGQLAGGGLMDKVGLIANAADLVDSISHGEWGDAISVLSKTAGDTIKDSVPGPVGYLSGTAINVWTDVFNQASKVDWSEEGRSGVADYAAQDPWGAASAAADAVVGYLPDLVGNVLPAKFRLWS